jgi:hypothetical protein
MWTASCVNDRNFDATVTHGIYGAKERKIRLDFNGLIIRDNNSPSPCDLTHQDRPFQYDIYGIYARHSRR